MTNTTQTFVGTSIGFMQGVWTQSLATPDKSGIDVHGGSYGAQLEVFQWLGATSPFAGQADYNFRHKTIYGNQAIRTTGNSYYGAMWDGTRRLEDATDTVQVFIPPDWTWAFENPLSDTPVSPPANVLISQERAAMRRVFGRVFGRVN
jgi:hypothetical protein